MSSFPTTIIFSIDQTNELTVARFEAFLEEHDLTERSKRLVGCYKGKREPSWIMPKALFYEFIRASGYVDNQESFLRVSGCNKAYATLILPNGFPRSLGNRCQVSKEVALTHDGWTHRPDINAWYICSHSNPDHSHELKAVNI